MRWMVLPKRFRNNGYSSGLEYPFLYGPYGHYGWMVWHRHTGVVVATYKSSFVHENERMAQKEADRLNMLKQDFHVFDYDSVA
jgi:hypothetical protein